MTTITNQAKVPTNASPTTELYIEFDGRQLIVRSDVAELLDFISQTYQQMLVPTLTASAGTIEVSQNEGECVAQLPDGTEFRGNILSLLSFLRYHVHIHFVRSRPDLLWLHAGAVERGTGCLLISGSSGQGKSTLVTLLCERGWRMLSDDVAPVRLDTLEVVPFLERPIRRIYPGREVPAREVGVLNREAVQISHDAIRREAAPINGIVFPCFKGGAIADLIRLVPGEAALELVRNCTNFVDHKGAAVDVASRIARAVPVYRLSYGRAWEAVLLLSRMG